MGRPATVYWDKSANAWATNALGKVCYTKTGRQYRTKVRNYDIPKSDKAAAWAWLQSKLEEQRRGLTPDPDLTFLKLSDAYLSHAEKTLPPESYARRVEHLDKFGNWPGPNHPQRMDRRLCRSITPADIRAFVDAMLKEGGTEKGPDGKTVRRGLSPSYVRDGLLKTIKRAFAWGASVDPGSHPGLPLESNPIAGVKGPDVKRRAFRPAEKEAVDAFMKWMDDRTTRMDGLKRRFAAIAVILLECLRATGCRPKELCSAQWKDYAVRDDGWGIIRLDQWKNTEKTGEVRIIALPPRCAERIAWIRALDGRHRTHIFTHRRGRGEARSGSSTPEAGSPWVVDPKTGHTKSLQKWFYRLVNEARGAGIPLPKGFRLYWLRSAYSTEAQRQGIPPSLIAKSMGTSERMLARAYTDLDIDDVGGAAKRVEDGQLKDSGGAA